MESLNFEAQKIKYPQMIENILESYRQFLEGAGLSEQMSLIVENTTVFILIILLAFLADRLTKRILVRIIKTIVKKSKNQYDNIFYEKKVFNRLAHIAPALVINGLIVFLIDAPETSADSAGLASSGFHLVNFIKTLTEIYMVLVITLVLDSVISAFHEIYMKLPISKERNIKAIVQVVKIIVYFIAALILIATISGKPVSGLLAGLGAFAAVIMLVFKDSILGLVASIQLSANNMVNVGDWIALPKYGADGDVIDIGLTTVKVQNWDKTIATIPTYALVSDSFNNWRGMEESGGRRIKRAINIDMQSVKFVDNELLKKFKKFSVLTSYINEKQKEIEEYNKAMKTDDSLPVNGRRMTNLGTFRKYLELYLDQHPKINTDMTFLIRHLQSTEKGLPIEIYVFSNDQAWSNYEAIQADIFDHILAIIPEFELSVFQNPTGEDFKRLGS
jgi:miniconductance mechanosensitive channel